MRGKVGKLSIFIGFVLGFLILVSGVSGATNVSSCEVISSPGTYVLNTSITNGSVTGCINITASDVILDGAGYTISGNGTGKYGIYAFNSTTALTNVTVKNIVVTDWDTGIYYNNTLNGNITSNTLSNIHNGIYLYSSSNNTITNNSASNNLRGIYLDSSSSNTLTSNNADSNTYGIGLDSSSNNTITNNNASNNFVGIWLPSSSSNTLSNNTANSNSQYGIYLAHSSNNTLTNNTASNNYDGIYLFSSSSNILIKNTANSNQYGIYLKSSNSNTLSSNTMSNNAYNFYIEGYYISNFIQTIDTGNTVNGKSIYYIVGASNQTINSSTNAGYVGFINGINVTVKDLILTNNSQGVLFVHTSNSSVLNVTTLNNYDGIYLFSSSNNTLINNTANSNTNHGIYLTYSSNNNALTDNTANSNTRGIYIYTSINNTLINNTANSNSQYGISLTSSSNYNTISRGIINNNSIYGIYIISSSYITVTGVQIHNNDPIFSLKGAGIYDTAGEGSYQNFSYSNISGSYYGIYLIGEDNSMVTGNIIWNNTYGIYLDSSSGNTLSNNTLHDNGWDFNSVSSVGNTIIANSFNNTVASFTYSGDIKVNSSSSPAPDPSGYGNIGKYLNITNMSSSAWVNLNVSYTDAEIPAGLNESFLRMWEYNNGSWSQLLPPNVVNTVKNYVYAAANITTFSIFAPLAYAVPPTINLLFPPDNITLISENVTFSILSLENYTLLAYYNQTPLVYYNLSIDGTVNKTGSFSPGSKNITVSGLSNGTHYWNVTVWDGAGVNTSATMSFNVLTEISLPQISVPSLPANSSNSSPIVNLSSYAPPGFVNETGVDGYQYVVYTNGTTVPVNLSVNVYIEPPAGTANISQQRGAIPGFYFNISVNDSTWFANVSRITLKIYYDYSLIKSKLQSAGISESTLRPVRYTNGSWVRLDAPPQKTLADGTVLYASGVVNHTQALRPYVWANLSHFSIYGIGGSVPSPSPVISPVSYGGVYTPEVTLLANSIDLSLAGELVNYLEAQGITVHITNAQNFSEYSKWQYVIILGGQNAYNGVGNIVANIIGSKDKAEVLSGSVYMKKGSVFRSGGVVYLFAGKDRNATREAWEEHYKEVAREIKYNWG